MSNEEMYREIILDLYENPSNYGSMESCDFEKEGLNTTCGDEIKLDIKLDGDIISDVKFTGKGCAIHTAAASLITDAIKGKSIENAKNITKDDMLEMLVVPIGPARMKCALLSWDTMQEIIKDVENKKQ